MSNFLSLERLQYYDGKIKGYIGSTPMVSVTASRNVATTDIGKLLYANSASAVQLRIPSSTFAVGNEFMAVKWNTGALTVKGASEVTINGVSAGTVTLADRYDAVTLKMISANNWLMIGKGAVV